MADQTHGAVDSLLGLLSSAIKDEARLLGGVHGDVQFIKDEMDSMNGFLMHLSKTEGHHDDQLRAWMKQVRDIAYVAEDCIELYRRDLVPPDEGFLAFLRHLPVYLWTAPARHRLATKIRELKLRVREVGERRLRYDVRVPATEIKPAVKSPSQDEGAAREAKGAFLQAVAEDLAASGSGCPSFSRAISMLPQPVDRIHAILRKLSGGITEDAKAKLSCMKLFLCALFLDATGNVLDSLEKKLQQGAEEPKEAVMILCYSLLSMQLKSCLQYLTAFREEKSISRTSLVRRWVAEGLVGGEEHRTPEEVGERCFSELLFRGFVFPVSASDAGTVRSCNIEGPISEFIVGIAKTENFVSELPSHLERQLRIRKIVLRSLKQQHQDAGHRWRNITHLCCGGGGTPAGSGVPRRTDDDPAPAGAESDGTATSSDLKDPMDDLVDFLKHLPEMYRLNVLDLGGCRGLKKRHLKSICKVLSLRYLSLRNTHVSRLPARHLQALRFLETLDIRGTNVPTRDMSRIYLPKLKHLLAGGADESAVMPRRIGRMEHMQTLSRVQVSEDGADLDGVANLVRLRKLGVVVHGNDGTARYLRRVISRLAGSLRSLSIWVIKGESLNLSISMDAASVSKCVLENLDIRGKCGFLPGWIKDVKTLADITLSDMEMKLGDLTTMGDVPGLRCLRLLDNLTYGEMELRFGDGQFKALKVLVVEGTSITRIDFVEGAAPKLEKIVWSFPTMDKEMTEDHPCSGTHHLGSLKRVELRGHGFAPQLLSNLKQAMEAHPNRPSFRCLSAGKVVLEGSGCHATASVY